MHVADRLIAHRGWQSRFPENTLPALLGAVDVGARHLEFDLQLGAGHQPLLCHDRDLRRLCGVDRDVCTVAVGEEDTFSVHEPERFGGRQFGSALARLADLVAAMAEHPSVTLHAELKRHSLRCFGPEAMLDAVLPHLQAVESRCALISFDLDVLLRARARGWQRTALVLSDWAQAFDADCRILAPQAVFVSTELLDGRRLRDLPWPVVVYEVGDALAARHWFDEGAAMVETFAIGELLNDLPSNGHG